MYEKLLSEQDILNLKDEDFEIHDHHFKITVFSFMVRELNLKGNELLIYAAIYSSKNKTLICSYSEISESLNISISGTKVAIKYLLDNNFITKIRIPNEINSKNIYSISSI